MSAATMNKDPTGRPGRPNPIQLEPENVVVGDSGVQYVVEKCLGTGEISGVYRVSSLRDPERKFALKAEVTNLPPERKYQLRLKVEVQVYDVLAKSAANKSIDRDHFARLVDKGVTVNFKYYVTDLMWGSLADVVDRVCGGQTSAHTKIAIARQTLVAIESLHELGYLHRDVKPTNFFVGMPPVNDDIIYLLDFGLARGFKSKTGKLRLPRARVASTGTIKYSSLAGLEKREQSRRDDLECWLYMMMELYDKDNLFWAVPSKEIREEHSKCGEFDIEDAAVQRDMRKRAIDARRKLFKDPEQYAKSGWLLNIPAAYHFIIRLVGRMGYYDKGDFTTIRSHLKSIVNGMKIDMTLPLDWFGKSGLGGKRKKASREACRTPSRESAVSAYSVISYKAGENDDYTKDYNFPQSNVDVLKDSPRSLSPGTPADKSDENLEGSEEDPISEWEDFRRWRKLKREERKRRKERNLEVSASRKGDKEADWKEFNKMRKQKKRAEMKKRKELDGGGAREDADRGSNVSPPEKSPTSRYGGAMLEITEDEKESKPKEKPDGVADSLEDAKENKLTPVSKSAEAIKKEAKRGKPDDGKK